MKHGYTDSIELKIFLIYHLLVSIRMDFDEKSALKERHSLAHRLTELAIEEYERRAKWIEERGESSYGSHAESVDKAAKLKTLKGTIEDFKPFKTDGRFFRDEFPHGYIGMLEYFGLWEEEKE